MASNTSVVRNRISIDGRVYEAKALGGGKFQVVTSRGGTIGAFAVRGRVIEFEDAGLEGADPVEQIALLWAKATLSSQDWTTSRIAPPPVKVSTPPPAPAPAPPPAPVQAAIAPAAPQAIPPAPAVPRIAEPEGAPLVEVHVPLPPGEHSPSGPPPPLGSLPPGPFDTSARQVGLGEQPDIIRGKSICRIATHARPEPAAFQRAKAYQAWLRTQPGVLAAYLAHDANSGKTMSVTIWEDRDKLAAIKNSVPPPGAVQLKSLSVDLLWIVA